MLSVGEAARYQAIRQIEELGATNISVRSIKPTEDTKEAKREGVLSYGLTNEDCERIRSTVPTVTMVVAIREFRKELRYLEHKLEGRVVAAPPEYFALNGLSLSRGRLLTDLDNQHVGNVAVLGAEAAEVLFPVDDPIGQSVRVDDNQYYVVVGVTARRAQSAGIGSSLSAQDYNRDMYIPPATDKARFGEVLTYSRAGTFQFERLEISQLTVGVAALAQVRQTADVIQGLIDQFHTQKDTALTVPLDLLEKAEETQRIFTIVLGAIASISLVVGGIGIMNIMLATVTERTREIGIRRAVGAKRRDIVWQFLVETMSLAGLGGVLGVAVGVGLSLAVKRVLGLQTIIQLWSPLLALAISLVVGLLFGTYPAHRAATMDPIEALRHE